MSDQKQKLILQYPEEFIQTIKDNFPNDKKMNLFARKNDYFLGSYLSELLDNFEGGLTRDEEKLIDVLYDQWIMIVEKQMDGQNLLETTKINEEEEFDKEAFDSFDNDALGG